MNFSDEMEILLRAIKTFGVEHQLSMLQEECGECSVAINHFRRSRIGLHELISEMVDVEIMIDQMKLAYPPEIWNKIKDEKLIRLSETILKKLNETSGEGLECQQGVKK